MNVDARSGVDRGVEQVPVEGPVLHAFDGAGLLLAGDPLPGEFDTVLVLTRPEGGLDLHVTERGEVIMFIYSGLRELTLSCGAGQPRDRIAPVKLRMLALAVERPLLVAWNVWHPQGARYPDPRPDDVVPLEPLLRLPTLTEVWVPARPARQGARQIQVELQMVEPGIPVLLAYSTRADLSEACGPHQAAIAVDAERLGELADACGAHEVVFDVELPHEIRHQAPVLDWASHNLFSEQL